MTPTKLHPNSSRTFLSGEADPELQCRRQERLGNMLSPMSASSGRPSSPYPADDNVLQLEKAPSGRKVCIEVIDETDSAEPRGPSSVGGEQVEATKNGDDSDEGPPPLSGSNPSGAVADASGRAAGSPEPARKTKTQSSNDDVEPPSLMEEMMAEAAQAREKKVREKEAAERKEARKASFGMKKGFLSSKPKNKSGAKKETEESSSKPTAGRKGETTSAPQHKKAASGFQKGFLDNPRKKASSRRNATKKDKTQDDDAVFEIDSEGNLIKSSEPTSEDIPTIRPKAGPKDDRTDPLRLEEVQDAMENSPLDKLLAGGEWVTEDLMQKMSENPRLAAGMSNPKFAAALQALQENPRENMTRFKDHPEVIQYLNEFCAVMGEHFAKMGAEKEGTEGKVEQVERDIGPLAQAALQKQAEQEARSGEAAPPDTGMSKEEKEQLDAVLSDKDLTAILMDPDMQVVMQECAVPGRMRMFMQHPEYGPKLRKLIQSGLLKVEG